tara:strand:+ start:172 stop:363 length:192 start_codon:yes stop_codon:yes gene_type:complete
MRYFLGIIFITGCAMPIAEKKWSDSYDPAKWRAQYEICKTKLFTKYPAEIDSVEWSKCIGEFK